VYFGFNSPFIKALNSRTCVLAIKIIPSIRLNNEIMRHTNDINRKGVARMYILLGSAIGGALGYAVNVIEKLIGG
jgi:hypothetical protein